MQKDRKKADTIMPVGFILRQFENKNFTVEANIQTDWLECADGSVIRRAYLKKC